MPPIKKRAGPSKHRLQLKHEDLQRVVIIINNYAEDNSIVLPGRLPGHKHFRGKLLPSHVTKAAVWRLNKESMTTLGMWTGIGPGGPCISSTSLYLHDHGPHGFVGDRQSL
jgi:hypothetical protein